jgi:chloride channel protein, CIC family
VPRPPRSFLNFSALYVYAALVGVAGAFFARGFQKLVDLIQRGALGQGGGIVAAARELPFWMRILVPVAGAVVAAAIVRLLARQTSAFGVADLMEVVSLRKLRVHPRTTIARCVSSAFVLATGGSVGREGPIVQLGAAFASQVAKLTRVEPRVQTILLGCGVSSGMAAAYNAPLGGAFFAMEVVLANFALEVFAPVMLASAVATLVMWGLTGGDAALYTGAATEHLQLLPILAGLPLGVIGGAAGVLFIHALEGAERLFARLAWPPEGKAALGGLVVGAIGIGFPEVWGNGYDTVSEILTGKVALGTIALLLVLKVLATSATAGSGGSGGVFTPTLFLGAALGTLFGAGFVRLLPLEEAPLAAFTVMGMAALIAGTTQAPVTSAVMLFEMTRDQALLLPLLLATIGSVAMSRLLSRDSIYARKLRAHGVPVNAGLEELTLHKTLVRDIMRGDLERVPVAARLDDVVDRFQETRRDVIYVVDGRCLVGRILLQDVKSLLNLEDIGPLAIAADLMDDAGSVDPDASIAEVIELFDTYDLEELAVTKVHDGRPILVGRVTRRDLIACLNLEVLKRQSLRAKFVVEDEREPTYVELPKGYSLARVPLPPGLAGMTVAKSRMHEDAHLTLVTLIERDSTGVEHRIAPHPDLVLNSTHSLVVLGTKEAVESFRGGSTE